MFNNPMQLISEFNRFKNGFNGDPQKAVMELVNSGKLSQKDLNKLQAQAMEFQKMMEQMNIRF